jgi:hypothetical protein
MLATVEFHDHGFQAALGIGRLGPGCLVRQWGERQHSRATAPLVG